MTYSVQQAPCPSMYEHEMHPFVPNLCAHGRSASFPGCEIAMISTQPDVNQKIKAKKLGCDENMGKLVPKLVNAVSV